MRFQNIGHDVGLNALFDGQVDGFLNGIFPVELLDLVYKEGVFPKGAAFLHDGGVVGEVDVEHGRRPFVLAAVLGWGGKQVGQFEDLTVRRIFIAVVKHDVLGCRDDQPLAAVNVQVMGIDVALVHGGVIEQAAQRHIRVIRALMFVQVERIFNDKGHIVLCGAIWLAKQVRT